MTRWLLAAVSAHMPKDRTDITDETHAKVENRGRIARPKEVVSVVSERQRPEITPAAPAPSRPDDGDPFWHGASVAGLPRTWTGRIVSLDEWRRLAAWDRHGPDGRSFCGACHAWVMPSGACHEPGCWNGKGGTV